MAKYAEVAPKVLALIAEGASITEAAEQTGINRDTIHTWKNEKPDFSDMLKGAQEIGSRVVVDKAVVSLIRMALGHEVEDVKTEYGSEYNDETKKYEPVIKKQVRVKKVIPPNIEALKFLLTNKAPDEWKNRQQNEIANLDLLKDLHIERVKGSEPSGLISHSEDEVQE